ncbi:MAG TPA: right-handed parallel beta-helix repeat-containing protein [Pseudomonadota bacterium]|nr:right-handed parallel beta-helix repeat-containing protein [Pseudomonadota bacterium]
MTGDGTQAKPFCEINQAVGTGKSYIQLKGNGAAMANMYQSVTVDSGRQVAILGPGRDVPAAQQALVSGVTVAGGARVTLSGLSVTNNFGQAAIQCSGSASLYVKNAQVLNTYNSGGGIYANQCAKVSAERTRFDSIYGNGILIVGGSNHRIINNAITNGARNSANSVEQYGIRLSGNADGIFSFNTIVNNLQGILCDSSASITDSIVVMNGTGAQVAGNCTTLRTIVDASRVSLDTSYQLTANSLNDACCVDKGMPDANMTIKDDYLGTKRPLGGGYDIGFHEAR